MSRNRVKDIDEHYEVYDLLDDYISDICKRKKCKVITCLDCGCCDTHCKCNDEELADLMENYRYRELTDRILFEEKFHG